MADITLANLTDATTVSDGTGVFDKLMGAVNIHVEDQYNKGRLTGTDYATVYLGGLQSAIQQAVQFLLQEQISDKQADLLDKQALTEVAKELQVDAQTAVLGAQKTLYERQTKGFDDNKHQKILEAAINGWSLVYPDASTIGVPTDVSATGLQALFDRAIQAN